MNIWKLSPINQPTQNTDRRTDRKTYRQNVTYGQRDSERTSRPLSSCLRNNMYIIIIKKKCINFEQQKTHHSSVLRDPRNPTPSSVKFILSAFVVRVINYLIHKDPAIQILKGLIFFCFNNVNKRKKKLNKIQSSINSSKISQKMLT